MSIRLRTALCDRLGIKYPVIQAPMNGVAGAKLCAAVSNAGGLGFLGAGMMTPEQLDAALTEVRALTDRPFGVGLLLRLLPADSEDAVIRGYRERVAACLDIVKEARVPLLASALGDPGAEVTQALHVRGIMMVGMAGSVLHARKSARSGADVIVAQGYDAGGHTGRIGTMSLVPQVVDAVELPVVAAGGIVDGRGLVAALALGAEAAWIGSRFAATVEALGHERYKQAMLDTVADDTIVTRAFTGLPLRARRNSFTDEWEGREKEILPFPLQRDRVGEDMVMSARLRGNIDRGSVPLGQGCTMIDRILTAKEVVEGIIERAEAVLHGASGVTGNSTGLKGP